MHDRNHYFGLGPIPKPKLANRVAGTYRNHISKGYLFHHNRALKPNLSQILKVFRLFLKILVYFQANKTQEVGNMRKFFKIKFFLKIFEKKIGFGIFFSALILIPKLDLVFGYRYGNLILVVHLEYCMLYLSTVSRHLKDISFF